MNWENIHTEKVDGFTIQFSIGSEDCRLEDCFDIEQEAIDGIYRDIEIGKLCWFVAKVSASKNGTHLADTYLGECLYDTPMQFVENDDYYRDMVEEVISEARQAIAKLVA